MNQYHKLSLDSFSIRGLTKQRKQEQLSHDMINYLFTRNEDYKPYGYEQKLDASVHEQSRFYSSKGHKVVLLA